MRSVTMRCAPKSAACCVVDTATEVLLLTGSP
jgi:hypothetical protein